MADFTKLVQHPDLNEIIQKLTTGVSASNISDWLKQKYPGENNKHLQISGRMLTSFLKSGYMNFSSQMRNELERIKNLEKHDGKLLSKSLRENSTWHELLEKQSRLENKEIDLEQMMADSLIALNKRLEQVFDVIQQNPEKIGNKEFALIKWVDTLFASIKRYDDVVNRKSEGSNQTNIYNIQIVQQHINVFQEAIRNVISRFDPEIASEIMTQLGIEFNKLNFKEIKPLNSEDRIEQLESIGASIKQLQENTP